MPVGGVYVAQCCGDDLDMRKTLHYPVDHAHKSTGIKFRSGGSYRAGHAEPALQVFLVTYEDVDILHDARQNILCALGTAIEVPQFLTEVEVERNDRPRRLRGLHTLNDHVDGCLRKRGKDPSTVEPWHTRGENELPVEVARLQLSGRLVRAVRKRRPEARMPWPQSLSTVAMFSPSDAVVWEALVEGLDSHRPHPLGDEVADGIVDDCGCHARLETETVGEIGRTFNSPPLTWIWHSAAFRKGMIPESRRCTSAPSARKSSAPLLGILRPCVMLVPVSCDRSSCCQTRTVIF